MSVIRNTSPLPQGPFGAILHRLDGTVLKVSQLRQSLRDLEIELNEIRKRCETAIHSHTPVASSANRAQFVVDTDGDRVMQDLGMSPGLISVQDSRMHPIPTKRKLSEQEGEGADRRTEGPISKSKRDSESSPAGKTPGYPIPGNSSSRIAGTSGSPSGGIRRPKNTLVLKLDPRSQFRSVAQAQVDGRAAAVPCPMSILFQHPPRPPTDQSTFPKDIDLSSYPPALKREGPDWFILFNPSPKVKQVLDVTLVHTFQHNSAVTCVKFSQNLKLLATGYRGTAQIYDVETGARTCDLHHGDMVGVWNLCFSPDGKYLATCAEDKQIRVWNIAEKRIHSTFEGHQGDIFSVHFSPNGRFIASGSHDRTGHIWDMRDRTFKIITIDDHYLPHGHHNGVWSMALSPDGQYVAVGSANTVVSIWEVTTGVLVQRLRGHRDPVYCVAFTPDGKGLISGSDDETLKYWDVSGLGIGSDASTALTRTSRRSSSPCAMNLTGQKDRVDSIAVSPDGNWIVSGSADGNVLFWDTRTGVVQCMLSGHMAGIMHVDFCPMGNFLATSSSGFDRRVRIWSYHVIE